MHNADSTTFSGEQLPDNAADVDIISPADGTHNISRAVVDNRSRTSELPRRGLVASGIEGISMTGSGLMVEKEEISPNEFNTLFNHVLSLHKSSCWLLGDVLLLGERRWGNRYTGSKYEEATAATGLSATTLRQIVKTCQRFPLETRSPELSFTHHREIANTDADYEQRTAVLQQAAQEKMSCAALRKHLHKTRFTEPEDGEVEKVSTPDEPAKLLDPENPMSIINLPERSAPDAPPLWDALKFIDWADKQDPEEYNLEQCEQALKLSEPIVTYHAAVTERYNELKATETAQND